MTKLILHTYQDTPVFFRDNAYLNATSIAKKFGKRPTDYLKIESTQNYIKAVTKKIVTEQNQLVITKNGGKPGEQGTWLHPKLSIDFARWLDADFAVWCDEQIADIIQKNMPETQQGDWLEQQIGGIKENFQMGPRPQRFLLTSQAGGVVHIKPIDPGAYILTSEEIINHIGSITKGTRRLVPSEIYSALKELGGEMIKKH